METENAIKNYFKNKNVFITGGSGFLGKALIEKLVRSCPQIENIYILIRPKKGKSIHERVEQITSCPLFESLRQHSPENLKKIIPINGDTTKLGLGISEADRRLLKEKVHIFYHAAASVKFDDFLQDAIFTNIRSAREAAMLALEMKHIEVFLHVSTTYCNIDNKKDVEEILYPQHGSWRKAINIAESCDTQTFNVLSQKFIGCFPNTYTYTKQLAEHCINDLLVGKLPTVICRPSVVVSTLSEPYPGWLDNVNGPVGLLLAGGSGLLRTVYGDRTVDTDYMAVDNVVKIMIVASWKKGSLREKDHISIYHASKHNLVAFKQAMIVELGKKLYWDVPFEKKIWFPANTMTHCWYNYFFNVILFHMIPAFFLDLLLRVLGYPPILFKIQRKIYIGNMAVSHFMLNEWNFINKNSIELFDLIPQKEVAEFNFKTAPVDDRAIYDYYMMSCDQARRHLLKEHKDISDETRVRTLRMYYLDRAMKMIFYGLAVWIIFFKINILTLLFKIVYNYWDGL